MSKTAYSVLNKKELDVEQLLALYGNHPIEKSAEVLNDIPDSLRTLVNIDVRCPSCGVDGAILVSGAKSKTNSKALRQPHFRFVGPKNEDAHLPFCEHSPIDYDLPGQSETINLQSERSQETRLVRDLVCKGIEAKIFDQSDIRAMRQWYFDLKKSVSFRVSSTTEALEYAFKLNRTHQDSLEHHPAHAELPNFNWRSAAHSKFYQANKEMFQEARLLRFGDKKNDAARLIERYRGREVFDVEALEPHYEKTIQLCVLVGRAFGYSESKCMSYTWKKAPPAFLAFCSLLLSISAWDLNNATEKLAMIFNSPPPRNVLLGNVIGLNPFLDYSAWRLIKRVSEFEKKFDVSRSFETQVEELEVQMKAEHLQWRKDRGFPVIEATQPALKKAIPTPEVFDPFTDL